MAASTPAHEHHAQHADVQQWTSILLATLNDAVDLLQFAVFEESWDAARAATDDHEEAFRELLRMYEQGLADLLRFIRASGLPTSAVGWSQLKTEWRRLAVDAGDEPTLRSALESGLYAAEQSPLSAHATYTEWASDMLHFVGSLASEPAPAAADEEARLQWAVAHLGPLEEHATFHAAFADWCRSAGDAAQASSAHDADLLRQPRYDLVLNTALRWLAGLGT